MNRERAKELLPIIQAFADGKTIQLRGRYISVWDDLATPANFDDNGIEWRIKPEPRVFWISAEPKRLQNWWLTQEEYDSGEYSTVGLIKTIEDLSDD